MASRNPLLLGVAGVLAAALGVGAALLWRTPDTVELAAGTALDPPRPLPALALVDHRGAPVTRDSFRNDWAVVFAGFTTCPDVCPTTLALLARLQSRLLDRQRPLGVVLLSVDPERDTPAKLDAYLRHFSPHFTGVTAPEPQLAQAAQAFGLAYARVSGADPQSYTMDHSAALVLVDPDAAIKAYFSPPYDVERLAADIEALMDARS